tara:strand:+ start:278 stop:394 length:117 start_codon:yes stop_codon:yes gene_type:complete
MKAAIKDATRRPNNPDGRKEIIAGYARSFPTIVLGKAT